ncbi:haloacid dehalogenase-like hydrolase domain-containing protein 2 [Dreissena polymorpha]|uniref:Haloacid dehalogenase-like hydrolase domain-containing protein 2 n=1 Tax=Dreissena polymorpha TaxID=45954 RepID=A0A9D3Y2C4_DREPO|nr:haloacid dehalogenase-like hydrolase domain-containing protein 2 [Dreissena polymorpha]KAH3692407.1 hypothetical protein DPMN_194857 [Dreissena polymorpha]
MFTVIKAVLIDLSGTIHIDDAEIRGSIESLNKLRHLERSIKFVTNTTKESRAMLVKRLHRIGFQIEPQEIFTCLTAARKMIDSRNLSPLLLLDDRALEDFTGIPQDQFDSVVVGLAPEKFNYGSMNHALRLVLGGSPLIAVHKARYYKRKDGLALGPGPFVSALEYAADCQSQVVGKPEAAFFLSAIEEFNVHPEECVMIGDDARDDVVGAIRAGMKGILVKTGKYRQGDERHLPPEAVVADDFPSAVDMLTSET